MKRRRVIGLVVLAGTASAGCAAPRPSVSPLSPNASLPLLRLPPSALGATRYAASQRLSVTRLDRPDAPPQQVDVQLQLDASGLLLAGFAFGQRVLLMRWDGSELQVRRHPRLPVEIDTDRMLRDLCLVYWPASAVRAALPAGWRWTDGPQNALVQGDAVRMTVSRLGEQAVEIVNPGEGYRLLIESRPLEMP